MHVCYSEFASHVYLKFLHDLFVVDIVLVFDFNRMIVLHLHWPRAEITHAFLTPLKTNHDRAFCHSVSLYLNPLSDLLTRACFLVTTKRKLCYKSRIVSSSVVSFELYLERQSELIVLVECFIYWSELSRKVAEVNAPIRIILLFFFFLPFEEIQWLLLLLRYIWRVQLHGIRRWQRIWFILIYRLFRWRTIHAHVILL